MPSNNALAPRMYQRTALLVTGDLLALLAFAAIGRRSHGEAAGFAAAFEVVRTAAPFIVGWLIAAPLAGAYHPATSASLGPMLRATLLGWSGALLVGTLLRAAMIGRFSPLSFYIVTFFAALLLLAGWRSVYYLIGQAARPRDMV
jgi:hypothetical protein